jgi:uncharacterized protein (DUF433 family)
MIANGFTPAQAAAITGLPLAAVHKAIDTRLIKPKMARRGGGLRRLLSKEQVLYLQLEAEGLRVLPLKARREVADQLQKSPAIDAMYVGGKGVVLVEIKSARRKVDDELDRLTRAEKMAVSDPEVLSGTPVYRGTRIPVQLVADVLAQGAGVGEILDGYPALNRELVELSTVYVQAFPRRGRPVRRPWAGIKPRRVSKQRAETNVRNR